MRNWLNNTGIRSVTGVGILLDGDGGEGAICCVSISKHHLSIDHKTTINGTLSDIVGKIPEGAPVALTLSGKGILIKRTRRIDIISPENMNAIFPNLKISQFYIQNFISGDYSYISVVRKEIVDQIVSIFSKAGLSVLNISVAAFPVAGVLPQLNNYSDQITFDGHIINYNSKYEWLDYSYHQGEKEKFPLKIDTESLPGNYLIAYASAFQLLLHEKLEPVALDIPATSNDLSEFKEQKKFKRRLSFAAIALVFLLSCNFGLDHYYSAANSQLVSRLNQNSESAENMQKLQAGVTDAEGLLTLLGWSKRMNYAYLCDQIGQTIPPSITLNELTINPFRKEAANSTSKESLENGRIIISGRAKEVSAVNNWMAKLNSRQWVKKVVLSNYLPIRDSEQQEFYLSVDY